MNLLERKTDFDEKVKTYLKRNLGITPEGSIEDYYGTYTDSLTDFKSIDYNAKGNYVQIEFLKTEELTRNGEFFIALDLKNCGIKEIETFTSCKTVFVKLIGALYSINTTPTIIADHNDFILKNKSTGEIFLMKKEEYDNIRLTLIQTK